MILEELKPKDKERWNYICNRCLEPIYYRYQSRHSDGQGHYHLIDCRPIRVIDQRTVRHEQ